MANFSGNKNMDRRNNMSILSGYKKFKKYIKTSSGFQLQSLWTSANTVEADDKRTIQTKVGAINGISSSETANSAEIAASTALTNKMNGTINNLSRDLGRVNVYVGSDGKLHFVNSGGADSVLPFNNKPAYYTVSTGRELAVSTYAEESIKITIPDRDGKTAVGGYITNIRVYNSNGDLQEAPIRCNYANKVLTVISSAGKWSSGWTAYYFDVVGIYI